MKFNDLTQPQRDCINHILAGEDSMIWATVGAGKTVIAQTAMETELNSGEVARWLVVAPKRVCRDTWATEYKRWEHLHVAPTVIAGLAEPKRYNIVSDINRHPIVVVNYELFAWLLRMFPRQGRDDHLPFDAVVFDEVDKLKDVSTARFKALRNRIGHFRKRIGMTGTPRPNKLTDVWGQAFVVDGGESFGTSFYEWRKKNFYPTDFQGYKWAPLPHTHQYVVETLSDIVFEIDSYEGMPVTRELERYIALPKNVRHIYAKLERELYVLLYDKKGKPRDVNADNSGVLVGKLQQLCAGFSYVDPDACDDCHGPVVKDEQGNWRCGRCNRLVKQYTVWHSTDRFDALDELVSELQGEQLMIVYHFQAELSELRRRYPDIHFLGGGVSDKDAEKAIALWNAGKIDKLALHPASAGHGLNLQHSGAHHIAFLTLPWSGGLYKQTIGRLVRTGQNAKTVFVHRILNRNTIDEDLAAELSARLAGQEEMLHAMRKRLEQTREKDTT